MSFQNHPRGSDPVAHLWHIVMCSSGSCLTIGETRFRFLHDASSGPQALCTQKAMDQNPHGLLWGESGSPWGAVARL